MREKKFVVDDINIVYDTIVGKFYGSSSNSQPSRWELHASSPNNDWFMLINKDTSEIIKVITTDIIINKD